MSQVSQFEIKPPTSWDPAPAQVTTLSFGGQGPDAKIIQAAYFNTLNTILGAGTMAVPAAMASGGLLAYEVVVVGVVAASVVSLRWLVAVAHVLPADTPRSYDGIASQFLGPAAASAISGAFILGGFSLNTSLMLLITKSLTPLLAAPPICLVAEKRSSVPILWGVGLLVVFPLCCSRKIEKLKRASAVGIAALAYASLYIVFSGSCHLRRDGVADAVHPVVADITIFECMAVTVSSFSCHLTALKTYETLGPHRTQGMMMRICIVSLIVAAIFYQLVGVTAYLQFGGDEISGNVLNNVAKADHGNPAMMLANCGLALCLSFSVPVKLWALRDTLIRIFRSAVPSARQVHALDAGVPGSTEPTRAEWIVATFSIIVAVLTIATLVPSIRTLMSIGGSVGGAFIVFIYPAAFHLAVVKKVSRGRLLLRVNMAEIAMISIGVGAGLLCLSVGIYKAVTPSPPPAGTTDLCNGTFFGGVASTS